MIRRGGRDSRFSLTRYLGGAGLTLLFVVAASAAGQSVNCRGTDRELETIVTVAMSSAQDPTVDPPQLMATLHQTGVRLVVLSAGRNDARVEDSLDEAAYRLDRLISAHGASARRTSNLRGEYAAAIRGLETAIEAQHCRNSTGSEALPLLSHLAVHRASSE
jgi:hypothetical protein